MGQRRTKVEVLNVELVCDNDMVIDRDVPK